MLGTNQLESSSAEQALGSAGGQAEHESAMHPCSKEC